MIESNDGLTDQEFVKVLSENSRYRVELIIDDEDQYVVRKRLLDLSLRDEFLAKANMMYELGQAGLLKGFAKVISVNDKANYYTLDYAQGENLSTIANQIDLEKDKSDIEQLKVELNKRFTILSRLGFGCKMPHIDDFIINSGGELIWFNYDIYHTLPSEAEFNPETIAQDLINSLKNDRIAESERLQIKEQARRVRNIKLAGCSLLAMVILIVLTCTPIVNQVKAWFTYDEVSPLINNEMVVRLGDKFGLLDAKYNLIIPVEYDEVLSKRSGDIRHVRNGDSYGLYNSKDKVIILDTKYQKINVFNSTSFAAKRDDKWALGSGNYLLTNAVYDSVACTSSTTFRVYKNGAFLDYNTNTRGYIYRDKDYIIHKLNGRYGFVNAFGDTIIEHNYSEVYPFKRGRAAVSIDKDGVKLYGIIDSRNKPILNIEYQAISDYNHEYAIAKLEGTYSVVELKDQKIIIKGYNKIVFEQSQFRVYRSGKSMIMNRYGQFEYKDSDVIPHKFNSGKTGWGYVDQFGSTVIQPQWCSAEPFKNGKAVVAKWGFLWNDYIKIDKTGREI